MVDKPRDPRTLTEDKRTVLSRPQSSPLAAADDQAAHPAGCTEQTANRPSSHAVNGGERGMNGIGERKHHETSYGLSLRADADHASMGTGANGSRVASVERSR
jgi:hypothetical protein